jgi:PucR-like helix-turn-helix protein/diguanylate cyclase with GGDEF domain
MTSADLQVLVDDVAQRLDTPAVLEDEEQRMIVYSSHTTHMPMDEVRRDSILRRETQPQFRDWFRDFGITVSTKPLRIPKSAGLGILGRLCVPIRWHGMLTGFLWLIDDSNSMSSEQVRIAEQAAEQASLLMFEDALAEKRGAEALRHLLSSSDVLRAAAAQQVQDEDLLPGRAPATVTVVQVTDEGNPHTRLALSEGLSDVMRRHERAVLLGAAFHDHVAILLRANGDSDRRGDSAHEIGCVTRDVLTRRLARDGSRTCAVVGIGDPRPLEEAYQSYRQARMAADTAAEIPSFGTVARWQDLGVYRAISLLPSPEAVDAALDPRFEHLLAAGDSGVLEALETYLDLCGDGQAAAERLYLHRGTLYYRLKKAQRAAGINLHDGRDRLSIHLAFKIARSSGRYPA